MSLTAVIQLASLGNWVQKFQQLYHASSEACAADLHAFRVELIRLRAEQDLELKTKTFRYAAPLTESDDETREEFFSACQLLVDRQPADVCRRKLLSLLCELTAIESSASPKRTRIDGATIALDDEKDPLPASLSNPAGGAGAAGASGTAGGTGTSGGAAGAGGAGQSAINPAHSLRNNSFGYAALRTLHDLMPSVVNIGALFCDCVEEALIPVINSMSNRHLLSLFPLLHGIVSDPQFNESLWNKFKTTSNKLRTVFDEQLRALIQDAQANAKGSNATAELRLGLANCCEFMTVVARGPQSSAAFYQVAIPSLILNRLEGQDGTFVAGDNCPLCLLYRLAGSMSRSCETAANYFGWGKEEKLGFLTKLYDSFKTIRDEKVDKDSHATRERANAIYCLVSILQHCEKARNHVFQKDGGGSAWYFGTRLYKLGSLYAPMEDGMMVGAAMDGLTLLTGTVFDKFREAMEAKEIGNDIGKKLQEICSKLMSTHKSFSVKVNDSVRVTAPKYALIAALGLMEYYSKGKNKVSNQLNQAYVQGFDRESVCFMILGGDAEKPGVTDDEIRLAAAKCMSAVSMAEFDKSEIRKVVTLFSTLPSLVTPTTYDTMSRLAFLMFRMSLDQDEVDSKGEVVVHACGQVFREIYASEVNATIFAILDKLSNKASLEQELNKTDFQGALVKLLQTAWIQRDMRAGLGTEPTVVALIKQIISEQATVRRLRERHFRRQKAKECIVCQETLTKHETERGIERCAVCAKRPLSEIHALTLDTFRHLYLEQTWIGTDVRNLLKCVNSLVEVDTIAFRVFHQLANVLDGVRLDDLVTTLQYDDSDSANSDEKGADAGVQQHKPREFERNILSTTHAVALASANRDEKSTAGRPWQELSPGRELRECAAKEYNKFNRRGVLAPIHHDFAIDSLKSAIASLPKDKAMRKDWFDGLRVMQLNYWRDVYGIQIESKNDPNDDKEKVAESAKFAAELEADLDNDHLVNLVLKKDGMIVGFCGGGPALRQTEGHKIDDAELYAVVVDTQQSDLVGEFQELLISRFCSEVRAKGFKRCFAWVHKQERVLFNRPTSTLVNAKEIQAKIDAEREEKLAATAAAKAAKADLSSNDPAAAAAAAAASAESKQALLAQQKSNLPGIENNKLTAKTRPFLYRWDLSTNMFYENNAHSDFVVNKGINLLVDFLSKDVRRPEHKYAGSKHGAFKPSIREKMDNFGAELTIKFNSEEGGSEKSGDSTVARSPFHGLGVSAVGTYTKLIELEFKRPNTARYPMLERPFRPFFEQILLGSDEENFLRNVTLPPTFRHQAHALTHQDFWGQGKKSKDSKKSSISGAGKDDSKYRRDKSKGKEMDVKGVASSATDAKSLALAHLEQHTDDEPNQLPGSDAANLLVSQIKSVTACALRAFYALFNSGSLATRRDALKVLRVPATLLALKDVLSSYNYGIRRSVFDDPLPDKYHTASKLLCVLEEILDNNESGITEAVNGLEVAEVIVFILTEMTVRLNRLLASRNADSQDQVKYTRKLEVDEESLMCDISRVTAVTINAVSDITLFPGKSKWIQRGNRECRERAMIELFTHNKLLTDSLYTFVLYDMESVSGSDPHLARPRFHNREDPLPYRDEMRVNIVEVFAEFVRVDAAYKQTFFEEFSAGYVRAELSMRPSMIQAILQVMNGRSFRIQLAEYLLSKDVFKEGEFIREHAFVEPSSGFQSRYCNLFIITNRAYYVSTKTYHEDVEKDPLANGVSSFGSFDRREFEDVRQVYRDFGCQMFCIRRHPPVIDVQDQKITYLSDVFVKRRVGCVQQITKLLARSCRDDKGLALPVLYDDFTTAALKHVYESGSHSSLKSGGLKHRLFAHADCLSADNLDAAGTESLLVWSTEEAGESYSDSGANTLVILDYSPANWQPYRRADTTEAKIQAKTQYPRFVQVSSLYDLSKLKSIEFTQNQDTVMVMTFQNKVVVPVRFRCDTMREMWRKELKRFLWAHTQITWTASILPNARDASRHTSKFL